MRYGMGFADLSAMYKPSSGCSWELPNQFKLAVISPLCAKENESDAVKEVTNPTSSERSLSWQKGTQAFPCGHLRCDSATPSNGSGQLENAVQGDDSDKCASTNATTHTGLSKGRIQEDSVYIANESRGAAGGELAMDCNGRLSLSTDGELFKVHDAVGRCFSLQSSTYSQLFLALNPNSSEYNVQGLTVESMGDISNSYWRYVPFKDIGECPPGSGYIALQYWGNHFGPPSSTSYYFVIVEENTVFKLAPKAIAAQYGCLGIKE